MNTIYIYIYIYIYVYYIYYILYISYILYIYCMYMHIFVMKKKFLATLKITISQQQLMKKINKLVNEINLHCCIFKFVLKLGNSGFE